MIQSWRKILFRGEIIRSFSCLRSKCSTCKFLTIAESRRNSSTISQESLPKPQSMLYRHLRSKILAGGAITVADYMREILTHPNAGYYMSKDVFGKDGDFTTSPEISQLFGEMIAIWTIHEWKKIGAQPIQLVELGPGRGSLAKDILKVYGKFGLGSKISLHLVEISPTLSEIQAKNICTTSTKINPADKPEEDSMTWYREGITKDGIKVFWYHDIKDIPKNFSIIIAHEFFDALPIHKFQKSERGWREVLIDIDPASQNEEKFRYVLANSETPNSKLYISGNERRDHVETSPQSAVIIDYLSTFLIENGGFALIADYGHYGDGTDTFRAFRRHKQHDPLVDPGSADLTADVDFAMFEKIATENDRLISFGPVNQRDFLKQIGIDTRLQILLKKATDKQQEQLVSGYRMITDADQMGERFKFLSLFPSVLRDHLKKWPVIGFQTLNR